MYSTSTWCFICLNNTVAICVLFENYRTPTHTNTHSKYCTKKKQFILRKYVPASVQLTFIYFHAIKRCDCDIIKPLWINRERKKLFVVTKNGIWQNINWTIIFSHLKSPDICYVNSVFLHLTRLIYLHEWIINSSASVYRVNKSKKKREQRHMWK